MAGYLLLCPGQGGQHPAMLDFALATTEGRAAIDAASAAAGFDVAHRVRAGDDLFEPVFAQVSMVAAAIATWRALEPHLPPPAAIAGYSVGEVSAWACAGTWTVAQAITLVQQRARLMVEASPDACAMLAVTGASAAAVDAARGADLHVAIEVETDHHILAGPAEALQAAGAALAAGGATLRPLPVSVPSHTPLLAPAAARLRALLGTMPGHAPRCPVLRGVDGQMLFASSNAGDALADAVCKTVRWSAVQREVAERGIAVALELPPGDALTRMFRNGAGNQARAVADFRSVEGVATWLARAA